VKKKRIGILTGGGDCAGLNPAVKWVVKTALDERLRDERGVQYEVVGIKDGWKGLIEVDAHDPFKSGYLVQLSQDNVRSWDRLGGTMLGTSRTNPYNINNDKSQQVIENINKLGLEALVAIGGEDTLGVAQKLAASGINVVGIPKTIDMDLSGTEYTLGFESAVNVITEEVDRLRTTASSHSRIFVVETMGRNAGWLALEGGEACGAFIILIPEYDFSVDKICDLLVEGRKQGSQYELIIVAEGAKPNGEHEFTRNGAPDSFGHVTLGGIAEYLAREIGQRSELECRSVILSHLQRGGAPCAYDRRMGRYFGIAAVDLIVNREFGKVVCYKNGRFTACRFEQLIGKPNLVDVHTRYDIQRYNGRRTILDHSNIQD